MKRSTFHFITGIFLLIFLQATAYAVTYSLPGHAAYDLGKLSKTKFDAKWGGGEIPDGMQPVRPGDYVSYSHAKLTYYFGPYKIPGEQVKARKHLSDLRGQLIEHNSKFKSARVSQHEIGNETGTDGSGQPPSGKPPEGKPPAEKPPEGGTPPEGKPGSETPPAEKPPGEKPGKPGAEGEPPSEKPPGSEGEEPTETEGTGSGKPPEGEMPDKPGEPGSGSPSEEAGEKSEEEGGGEPSEKPSEETPEESPEGEASEKTGESEASESETDPETGEPSEEAGEPGEEGEPSAEKSGEPGEEGEASAEESEESGERPEDTPPPPATPSQPPPDFPAEPPAETTEFEDQASGTEVPDKALLEKLKLAWPPFTGKALPAKVDLSPDMPPPGTQGEEPSCVSWVIGYALKSFQEKQEEKWPLYQSGKLVEKHVFSPAFLHSQIYNPKTNGALLLEGLNIVQTKGACTWPLMPYSVKTARNPPSRAAESNAELYRIDFFRLVKAYDALEVKAQLDAGYPLALGALVDPAFSKVRGKTIWKQEPKEKPAPHAMLCVGYDDDKQAFKLINSWGPKWGDNGYAWIDYETFTKIVPELYVIKDGANRRGGTTPGEEAFKLEVSEAAPNEAGEIVFKGTFTTAPDYPGRANIQLQFTQADKALRATSQAYSTIHGQAGALSSPITLPSVSDTAWEIRVPRRAFSESGKLKAEAILFVDDFGITNSATFDFELATPAEEPETPAEEPEEPGEPEEPEAPAESPEEEPEASSEDGSGTENGDDAIDRPGPKFVIRLAVFAAVAIVILTALGFGILSQVRRG